MQAVIRCKKCNKPLETKIPKVFVKGLGVVCKDPCSHPPKPVEEKMKSIPNLPLRPEQYYLPLGHGGERMR
jgi:hypothetical protein